LQISLIDPLGNTLDKLSGVAVTCSVSGQIFLNQVSQAEQVVSSLNVSGTTMVYSVNGIVRFDGLFMAQPGRFILNFQARSFSVASAAFVVVHNKLDRFEFLVQPTHLAHGVAWKVQPRVQLVDAYSNLILIPYHINARLYAKRIAGTGINQPITSSLSCSACSGNPVQNVLIVSSGIIQFTDLSVKIWDTITPQIVMEDGLGLEIAAYNISLCENLGSNSICNPDLTEIVHQRKISTVSSSFNVYRVSILKILSQPTNSTASRFLALAYFFD
jgi:hypothetical protein